MNNLVAQGKLQVTFYTEALVCQKFVVKNNKSSHNGSFVFVVKNNKVSHIALFKPCAHSAICA
jgi:hypothetical protein